MKSIGLKICALIVITILYVTFNAKSTAAPHSSASVKLGYVNKAGAFVAIQNEHLLAYYKHMGILGSAATIEDFEIKEITESGVTYYFLYSHGIDGEYHAKVVSNLTPYNNNPGTLQLQGKICACKSKNCTTASGCDVSLTPLGSCSCTACSGEGSACEKTSSVSSLTAISDFFERIGVVDYDD